MPGRPVRGARTSRCVVGLLDLLGRRAALCVLWELRDGHAQSFRLLRASCDDMSPSVLNTRLGELRAAKLLETGNAGYVLTAEGMALMRHLKPLNRWADGWSGAA